LLLLFGQSGCLFVDTTFGEVGFRKRSLGCAHEHILIAVDFYVVRYLILFARIVAQIKIVYEITEEVVAHILIARAVIDVFRIVFGEHIHCADKLVGLELERHTQFVLWPVEQTRCVVLVHVAPARILSIAVSRHRGFLGEHSSFHFT
jgi:hypothetical protein